MLVESAINHASTAAQKMGNFELDMIRENESLVSSQQFDEDELAEAYDDSHLMYDSKVKTNQLWNLNLNTQDPIAPHQLKNKALKKKIFAENFENMNSFGTMDLFHGTPPKDGPIHTIKEGSKVKKRS